MRNGAFLFQCDNCLTDAIAYFFKFRHFCSRLLLLPNASGVRGHELRFQMEDRGAVQVQEMRVQLRGLQGKVSEQDQQPDDVPRCGNNHNVVPHRGGFGAVQVPDIDVETPEGRRRLYKILPTPLWDKDAAWPQGNGDKVKAANRAQEKG